MGIGTLAKLFAMGQVKLTKNGEFLLLDRRAVILYFDILEGMLDYLVDIFGEERGGKVSYLLAKEGSKRYIENVIKKLGYTGEKAIDFAGELASIGGWGKISVVNYDSVNKQAQIIVENCPFSQSGKPKSHPVCHFTRGMFAGSACIIWKEDVECIETNCARNGAQSCTFVLKRRAKLKWTDITKTQIPTDKEIKELKRSKDAHGN